MVAPFCVASVAGAVKIGDASRRRYACSLSSDVGFVSLAPNRPRPFPETSDTMKTGRTGTTDLEATREREPIRTRETRWQIVFLFLAVSSALLVLIPLARDREPFAAVLGGRVWW